MTRPFHETPTSIGTWMTNTFPGGNPNDPAKPLRALKELVELCFAAGARPADIFACVADSLHRHMAFEDSGGGQKFHESRPKPEKIAAEVADVVIVLMGYSFQRDFNLQDEIDRKMAVNRTRKWRCFGDGTGQHIPDESDKPPRLTNEPIIIPSAPDHPPADVPGTSPPT